jgi:hypothetical protein
MPRRLLAAAATGALLLGLAGCGDGENGPVTTSPPSISIGGPSDGGGEADPSDGGGSTPGDPTAATPDIPPPNPADYAGMDEHTPEGAAQAFRYYIAVTMWAHQTGDDSTLKNLRGQNCTGCEEFNEPLDDLQANESYWSDFTVSDILVERHDSDTFEHEIGYQFVTSPHSRPADNFDGRIDVGRIEYTAVGGMAWDGEQWIVEGMQIRWGADVH